MPASIPATPPITCRTSITVLVLAAGQGRRFAASGGQTHKLQALLHGKPVLQHVLDTVAQAGLAAHVVHPVSGVTMGMGDSIAHGVHETASSSAWLILPGDMPLVQAATLRAIAMYMQPDTTYDAVQPVWHGQMGHPVAFSARCASELLALQGDQGARVVLQQLRTQGKVHSLSVEDAGVVHDIDTLNDLEVAAHMLAQRGHQTDLNMENTYGCC